MNRFWILGGASLLLLLGGCTRKSSPVVPLEGPRSWKDTSVLRIDSVRVNGVRTDSLKGLLYTASCDTVAAVQLYLSKVPRFQYGPACRSVLFNNGGNSRFACFTCLKFKACNATDSLPYVFVETVADSIVVTFIDTTENGIDTSYAQFSKPYAILNLLISHNTGLGSDTGSCTVVVDTLYDGTSDSLFLSDTLHFTWAE